mmetsp:Transcript_62368/g.203477  ORF Transcript_62368/g.203477 Transcript_62368/m.203477 type:complete len:228 (+) Transcript_62368:1693-2376(+)
MAATTTRTLGTAEVALAEPAPAAPGLAAAEAAARVRRGPAAARRRTAAGRREAWARSSRLGGRLPDPSLRRATTSRHSSPCVAAAAAEAGREARRRAWTSGEAASTACSRQEIAWPSMSPSPTPRLLGRLLCGSRRRVGLPWARHSRLGTALATVRGSSSTEGARPRTTSAAAAAPSMTAWARQGETAAAVVALQEESSTSLRGRALRTRPAEAAAPRAAFASTSAG